MCDLFWSVGWVFLWVYVWEEIIRENVIKVSKELLKSACNFLQDYFEIYFTHKYPGIELFEDQVN